MLDQGEEFDSILDPWVRLMSDFEILHVMFPKSPALLTAVWILGTYLELAYPVLIQRGPCLSLPAIRSQFVQRFSPHLSQRRVPLQHIQFDPV